MNVLTENISRLSGWLLATTLFLAVACNSAPSGEHQEEADSNAEGVEEEAEEKPAIASPRKQAVGRIGQVRIVIDYGSPGVKGREIWGGLEEYGAIWRAGANETTSIDFSKDVKINETVVPAGKYGFYLIPNENESWVAIINTDWNRETHGAWGAYNYTPEHDVVRVQVEPEWSQENRERLEYSITDSTIRLTWEKARISIPVIPDVK